jgi:proteasome lid subunit RPN8/RPN11
MPSRVAAGIRRHAAEAAPGECCGALMGRSRGGWYAVQTVIPLPNETADPARYSIGAPVVLRLELQAQRAGVDLIGFYHSHPTGEASPSVTDLEMACPGYIYFIVDGHGALRAWRLKPDRSGFSELATGMAGAA